ncbi:TetR/AcrR family transcriptional regulator [Tissierella sp. MB52-C2]|uniref:TetR/AcrR family transcriptional regulator n=1 Tax=Tissierella sp. MB52-C2 TaxID=3070999 RepID=UPI00280AB1AD|nr:TetR/AcrR family transcriptional regulator [Tissierella sp. MB52-C2]WMM25207.1 TetR/AcrR family transcriptional regulator [Tissierella sp. MB52-C2]
MRDLTSTEEKILDKTLYLIGKTGTFNVPIRTIAKEADVNVSAINYYFRTKDEMLRLVKDFYIDNTISAYSILDNNQYDDKEKIILCANEIMEYTLQYPGVLVILKEAKDKKDSSDIDAKIIEVTDTMNAKLDKILSSFFTENQIDFQYKKMIFLSSLLYPTLHFDIQNFDEGIIHSKDERLKYITYIVDMLNKDN